MALVFKSLTEADLPTLTEWLNRPHVAECWDASTSLEEVRTQYLPCLVGESAVWPYFVYLDGVPIGYIQSYLAADAGDGWWLDEHDPGVRGIDQFLADGQRLGQGLGTQMVTEFVQRLFEDPNVTKIQADPRPSNERAIRCYEKSGFRRVGPVDTPDGAALLMVIERISE
jgi:aminoglycoside 6'-N-acetyltransferase-1b